MTADRQAKVRSTVSALIDAWNAHDLAKLVELHTADTVGADHIPQGHTEGREELEQDLARILADWPDLRFETRSLRVGDDFAVFEWTATATHTREVRRLGYVRPPTGKSIAWNGVDIFALDGEKVARTDAYIDVVGLLGQLGVELAASDVAAEDD